MKAEIISVGTELMLGEITDTNASYLAGQLPTLGIDLLWVSQVGDNRGRLVEIFDRARGRSDLVLVTGGLGPTEDDLTRETLSESLNETMKVDPTLEKELREFFAKRNYQMPERNLKQATLIPSAKSVPNPRGTAPGWWVEKGGKIIVLMPGPPSEMRRMWDKEVSPRLRQILSGDIIVSRTLKTFGIGEGTVDEMISPLLASNNPSIGVYAKADGIHLRVAAKAKNEQIARDMIAPVEEKLRSILGKAIWGTDAEALETVVGNLLRQKGLTVSVAEFGTGGYLSNILSGPSGCTSYLRGAYVACTPGALAGLGVDEAALAHIGIPGPEAVALIAQAVRRRFGTAIGLAICCDPEPAPTAEKPMDNVYLAVSQGERSSASKITSTPQPELRRGRASVAAMFLLRKHLESALSS